MKSPIHRWKQFFTYADGREPHWTFDGKPCWLGSGVTDKKGVEIFEGDLVNCGRIDGVMTVVFYNGVFCLENHIESYELPDCKSSTLEVIGHVMEETTNDNRP